MTPTLRLPNSLIAFSHLRISTRRIRWPTGTPGCRDWSLSALSRPTRGSSVCPFRCCVTRAIGAVAASSAQGLTRASSHCRAIGR
jgi:hypothetical protein